MRILVIGDLHGRKPIIQDKDFDCLVLVGDICDDRDIAPLWKKYFHFLKKEENQEDFFEDFLEFQKISETNFEKLEEKSLKKGNELMKYFDSFNKPIFMVAGNWDQSYGPSKIKDTNKDSYSYLKAFYDWWLGDKINSGLIKGTRNVINCTYKNNEYKGINFIGYGLSSAPEELSKRKKMEECTESQYKKLKEAHDKIKNKLENSHKKRKNKNLPTFFITHNIPYNTKLDTITDKKSIVYKKHMGSTMARDFCERFQPQICVGGHIHDHTGRDKIGKTIVINPGFGAKAMVTIDFDEKKGKCGRIKFLNKDS